MSSPIYDVDQRPPLGRWIPLSFQHVFAMFSATVLVPLLTGLSPAVALFTSGIGTLLYILITGGKVPTYLGSSFAYIAPLIAVSASHGVEYALGAAFCVGIFYLIIAFIIKQAGTRWLDRMLPPVVIGSVIIVIGLKLAPVAMNMAMYPFADAANGYAGSYMVIAAVIAVLLSFIQKVGALIQTIPTPVMGGISMMLFGIIASAGIRTVVESGVDYSCKRNLTITSVILVIGIGGGMIMFPITESLNFQLADVALATFVGIILNLVLPQTLNDPKKENEKVPNTAGSSSQE